VQITGSKVLLGFQLSIAHAKNGDLKKIVFRLVYWSLFSVRSCYCNPGGVEGAVAETGSNNYLFLL